MSVPSSKGFNPQEPICGCGWAAGVFSSGSPRQTQSRSPASNTAGRLIGEQSRSGERVPDLEDRLRRHWGYDSFRPLQERIVNSLLKERDVAVVMPTGAENLSPRCRGGSCTSGEGFICTGYNYVS